MRRLITDESVAAAAAAGLKTLAAPRGESIVTPAAWSMAQDLGVTIDQSGTAPAESAAPTPAAERTVDPSGVVVVRGRSVQLDRFAAAGPDTLVGLRDVVTGKDGSPMTAGFMAWSHADSFPWQLTYDEIDYVLEGVLHLGIDGRVVEGRPGDVLFVPKGSRVVFGTPSSVRVFYVTWPADWNQSTRP